MTSYTQQQVEALLEYLDDNPNGVSRWEIHQHLQQHFRRVRHVPGLVYLARNRFGKEVIVTQYDYYRGQYLYSFAQSLAEGATYVERRVRMIRAIIFNVIGLIDRLMEKFPDEAAVPMQEARARLIAAHTILDDSRQ